MGADMPKTGNEKLIEQLMADGCYYMFGNPGTVEQGFLDAMGKYIQFHYITCLQESIAVAMADGYARKTGEPAIVQLHSGVGLGNGIGMIYQAMRGHSPLVILAGEAGIKYDSMDAQMACDLVSMARPVTKWSGRVVHKDSILRMLRRAVKIAITPPMGPVFLALPLDILSEVNTEPVYPSCRIDTKVIPESRIIEETAKILLEAAAPQFIIGDGISASGGSLLLTEAAELLGAQVYGADSSSVNCDRSSYLYQGELGHMFGTDSCKHVNSADVIFIAGTYVFPEVFPCLENPFREDAKIIHVDINTYEIGKNFHTDIGIAADPSQFLEKLISIIKENQTDKQKSAADKRKKELKHKKECEIANWKPHGIFDKFCSALKEISGGNIIIFDEALTSSDILNYHFRYCKPGTYFQTRGGSLGVGIPGAMGIKLARPDQTVAAFTGDGGSLYTIQALQTAARYNIGAKFIIINNGSYRLLKNNIDVYWTEENITPHEYPGCFTLQPQVNFTKLSESMGVKARCLTDICDIREMAKWLLSDNEPALLEINTNEIAKKD